MKIDKEKYYIVRGVNSGVFFGKIEDMNGTEVTMTSTRCLWMWSGAFTILEIANNGVTEPDGCEFTIFVDEICILDACEIIPCTQKAVDIIKGIEQYVPLLI